MAPEPAARFASQPLILVVLCLALGIWCDRDGPVSCEIWSAVAVAAWLAWAVLLRGSRSRAASLALGLSIFAAGAAWHHACWSFTDPRDLGHAATLGGAPVAVEVRALEHPRLAPAASFHPLRALPGEETSALLVECLKVRDGQTWHAITGRARLTVSGRLGPLWSGDRLLVYATLEAPEPTLNPGQTGPLEFARMEGRLSRLHAKFPECVTLLEQGSDWSPARGLDRLRAEGSELLAQHLGPSQQALATALLLGTRVALPPEQVQDFVSTGTIHVLAISGMHVAMLASVLFLGLRIGWLPRGWALLLVALVVAGYALLTEAQPPVVRAAVLVWIICGAHWLRRQAFGFNSLAAAGIVVLLANPTDLFRAGPQLSFLAVAAMCGCPRWPSATENDPLERLLAEARPWYARAGWTLYEWAKQLLWLSLAVWIVTTPWVMDRFHLCSPLAILLNLLLWPFVAGALLAGFGVLACGPWCGPLASVLGGICRICLDAMANIVATAADLPGSHVWVCGPPGWWMWGFYLGLLAWIAGLRTRVAPRWAWSILVLWTTLGLAVSTLPKTSAQVTCTFLAVGHGNATLIEWPDGRAMLVDAGQLGPPINGARIIADALWESGRTHLDALVLSHSDVDHYNATPELLRRFSLGVAYLSPTFEQDDGLAAQAVLQSLREARVPIRILQAGDRLKITPDYHMLVLHPPAEGVPGSDNSNSLVLSLESATRRVLLPGDLEPPGMYGVLRERPRTCDVLAAPHHGSPESDPPAFARWARPRYVIFSRGPRVGSERTRLAYEQRSATVLVTAESGALRAVLTSNTCRLSRFSPRGWIELP